MRHSPERIPDLHGKANRPDGADLKFATHLVRSTPQIYCTLVVVLPTDHMCHSNSPPCV
jgi:hypothetical protein